ncbi:MAG: NADH-quinone oxidoreductase subunit NuoN [Gemmatimonas sp.]|nr:NADH-quinone oxidoreductase subunit NuoN [Gemmatimonas sp.]
MTLDFASQADYLLALLPEIVLSLWAMLVLMVDVFQKGNRVEASRPVVAWLSLAGLVVTAAANGWLLTIEEAAVTGMVAVDSFRVFVNFIVLIAAALAILISIGYLDRRGINRGEFYALLLFATVGMMLLGAARDLILLFLALELMSVALYVLVGFDRRDPRSSEGALKYFLLGSFSSGFLLYGIALVFGSARSTNLSAIVPLLPSLQESPMFLIGAGLLLVGLAFKVAVMPFHVWTPDAYDGAPTPVTALMATGVKAAAFAAFIRVFAVGFAGIYNEWSVVLSWLALLTMFGANLIALTQGSVKRMLAYSSIAHAGYLLVAVLAANAYGAAAFLFYLLVYTLMTAGAFGIVIANSRGANELNKLDDYAGFGWREPLLGAVFSIFLLSLAGFPLTGGFIGKLYILRSSLEAGNVELAVSLVLASVISYFYYLRVVVVMYMRPAPAEEANRTVLLTGPGQLAMSVSAVAVLALFFVPGWVLDVAQRSVASLFTVPGTFFGLGP